VDPINQADVEPERTDRGDASFERRRLADAAGGEALGCSHYRLPPGGRSWPYHHHTANEEALYVLSGSGGLRTEAGETALAAGDYVALPADERGAHRVFNDGDEALVYLALSTMVEPDVTVYPDRGTIGVFAGAPPGGTGERDVHGYHRRDETVGYWGDEDDA
jgi:uncharacterized cupin superfamily protein